MQFDLKFLTLLTLVGLVGSALGQPVANGEIAGEPSLVKRFNFLTWTGPRNILYSNNNWLFNGQPIWQVNGVIAARVNNGWYNLPQTWFPNSIYPQGIRTWTGFL
ncbi:secreted protein [Melampsora americana]|nr:secreted protein [Melampsora americana]